MSKRPSLKINAISNWTSLVVQVAVGFFLTPFVISYLGRSGYGIWTLVGSFIGYYGLLNLGIGSAITRYIARYAAQKDDKRLNETANTALAMFCVTGLLAILISFLVAAPLAHFFKVPSEKVNAFKHIVWALGIATGLSFPSGVFSAMITAREHFVAVNVVNITATLLRAVLTVAILLAGYGLAGIAYPTLAATVVSLIAVFFLVKSVMPEFRIRLAHARLATLKMLLVYGGYTTIISVADILRMKIDSIVIGKMIGLAEVGIYGVAALLVSYMLRLVVSGMGILTPRFAALDGAGHADELRDTFLRSLSISSFIACGAALMALLFGRAFILLWVGPGFEGAIPVLGILAVSYAVALSQTPGIGLLYAVNKHRYYAAVTMAEAIANLLLSILLARLYGIIGVALGTAIPMFVVKLLVQPIYVSRVAGIRFKDYVKAIGSALVTSMAIIIMQSFLVTYLNICLIESNSYFLLGIGASVTGAIYFVLNCLFSPTIRRIILSFMAKSCGHLSIRL
ncbi:MAG: oligosaccharide flippase family protein [Deltaproteobacteria bacterium]|nr:oligosaccharide flippase family protein [Deltaproteobacteria bacterium]